MSHPHSQLHPRPQALPPPTRRINPLWAINAGLAAFALIAIAREWNALVTSFASVGPAVVAFNLVSLLAGYYLSRAAGMDKSMATAISFEIGIHNSTLAIYIALSVLDNFQLALPAAIYSVSMYITATLFGMLVLRRSR